MASTTLFITDGNRNPHNNNNNKHRQLNFERFTAADHEQWFDDHLGNTAHHQLTIDQLAIGGAALMPNETINPSVIIQDMDNKETIQPKNNDKLLLLPKGGYKAHLPVYLQPSLSTPMAPSHGGNRQSKPIEKMLSVTNPRTSASATTHNHSPVSNYYSRPTNQTTRRSARPAMNTNNNSNNDLLLKPIHGHSTADNNIDWKANPGPSIPLMSAPLPPPEDPLPTGHPHKDIYSSLPNSLKGKYREGFLWPTSTPQKETQETHVPGQLDDQIFKGWSSSPPKGISADQGTQTYDHDPEPPKNDDLPEQINHHSSEINRHHKQPEEVFHFISHLDPQDAFFSIANHLSTIAPIEQWSGIVSLDLSHQGLVSIMDLSDILPHLEYLNISHNAIYQISGLPASLQTIKAQTNRLTDIEGFNSLPNLHQLDLCDNAISTFQGFGPCPHLRVLHAENNKIYSCKPFQHIRSLTSLNLRSNVIKRLRFRDTELLELESLDVSYNRIQSLDSIEGLPSLKILNLDHNDIESVFIETPMDRLKILRLSYNRLKAFNGSLFPDLRTLYLDTNQIKRIVGLSCIPRLNSFSARNQGGNAMDLNLYHLRGSRKIYLSGNPMKRLGDMVDFFTLEYIELCSAQLEELPSSFARQMPNLVVVYLSNNFLTSIRQLRELRYLRKLVLLDNRISNLGDTVDDLSSFHHLYYLDLRENPISQKFYPPVTPSSKLKAQPKLTQYLAPEHDLTWSTRDDEFQEQLPDHWRVRREGYRASLIKYCASLKTIDNVWVKDEERDHADAAVAAIREQSKDMRKALEDDE
ncbi:hypothetical protein CLU79DRAFT_830985 [Phycomyces nitens]|nr:hypothetical protein CLU79DRAFT_830985 [Phycomyces nitens]